MASMNASTTDNNNTPASPSPSPSPPTSPPPSSSVVGAAAAKSPTTTTTTTTTTSATNDDDDRDYEGGIKPPDYHIVAAIDFGTTFSGYAYSFASNREAIHVNKNWGQTQGFLLHKTPTCLLLKPDGQFEAFGFEATSRYNDLCEDEAADYYYFDRFKMKLYDNKVSCE